MNLVEFRATHHEDTGDVEVVPYVDGIPLITRALEFEAEHGMTPAGGYGGIYAARFKFGDLSRYFLGQGDDLWHEAGRPSLLGCDCGELGCWPLQARVVVVGDTVTWLDFCQPHRPARDYSEFGPFVFERAAYEAAAAAVVEMLGSSL